MLVQCLSMMVLLGNTSMSAQTSEIQKQRLRLVPRNEAARAPGFGPVLAQFEKALRERNTAAVMEMMSEEIRISAGNDDTVGPTAVRRYRNLDNRRSEFWTIAEDLLRNGSAFWGDCENPEVRCYVTYPYWSERFPDDKLDRIHYRIARRDEVQMYAEPRIDAAVVERLSYDIVREPYDQSKVFPEGWEEVVLFDGRRGWVQESDLYNPTFGYRMTFVRRSDGKWLLGAFLAGD